VVGKGEAVLGQSGIRLRFIVGSPSSYVYFGDERPSADGSLAPFAGAAACPSYNRWKYGFAGDMPPYVAAAAAMGVPALESRYVKHDIVYLAGGDDVDPNHRVLDKSCAGEAQGPNRLARMRFFLAAMARRDGNAFHQPMHVVAGAAHDEAKVFGSPCGRAALFGDAACGDAESGK
jgi:hypothetical protein